MGDAAPLDFAAVLMNFVMEERSGGAQNLSQ
jgi:hypothetical protein